MADSVVLFDCSICLQLLEDPVTTSCGHSYCLRCINTFWDSKTRGEYSCPQCRQTFTEKPVLKRNTLLAALLEEHRKSSGQSAAAEDGDLYAEPGDVPCDACTERKRKASMFCLVCLVSYCESHLKPHFEVPPLKKHKLIQANARIQECICERHNKLLEIICRTDQQLICLECVIDGHKGHDTVTVAAEKCEMQRKLHDSKEEVSDRVLFSERRAGKLRQAANAIRDEAWKMCDEFEQMCAESICLYVRYVERQCSEMREKVGDTEKAGVDWIDNRHGELQREVVKLRKREEKLNQLSQTENPVQLFKALQAMGDLPTFSDLNNSHDKLAEFVDEHKVKLRKIQKELENDFFRYSDKKEMLTMPLELKKVLSRSYLLTAFKNSKIELDPNTVFSCLCLSNINDEISWGSHDQARPDHPDRFTFYYQALCKTGLTMSHYWEVEWDCGVVDLAVSYKSIDRKGSGNKSCFGHNNISWKLTCSPSGCVFWHNCLHKGQIPAAVSRRVGIHLDYGAGSLAFYSVSDSDGFTLLHKIQTKFTQPLYPGFSVDLGSTLKICNI